MTKGSKSKFMRVNITLAEQMYPPIKSVRITGSQCLPDDIHERIMERLKPYRGQKTNLEQLNFIRDTVETWYRDRGYTYSSMREIEGLDSGNVTAAVYEPRVRNVSIKFVDDQMKEVSAQGGVTRDKVLRTINIRPGEYYSALAGRQALQEAFNLQARPPHPQSACNA